MKRMTYLVVISALALMIVWLGGFLIFHRLIRSYQSDETTETDVIVALTGGRNRLAEAMRLYNKGLADILIISGVGKNITLEQLEKENHVAINRYPQNVILGQEATNTIENAIEVSEVIRRNNAISVRLVTSYYHMPRSEQEILAMNPDVKIVFSPVYSQNVSDKWWKRWGSFYLIVGEYNKFVFVYVKNFVAKLKERD